MDIKRLLLFVFFYSYIIANLRLKEKIGYKLKEIYKPNKYFRLKNVFFFGENSLFLAKVK